MTTASLLAVLLSGYGITFTLRDASILDVPRFALLSRSAFLQKLFSCAFCLGFWCTTAAAWLWGNHSSVAILYGFAGAPVCWLLDLVGSALERYGSR